MKVHKIERHVKQNYKFPVHASDGVCVWKILFVVLKISFHENICPCVPSNSQEGKNKSLGNPFREEAIDTQKHEKSNVSYFICHLLGGSQRRESTHLKTGVLKMWSFTSSISMN